ncbi:hypothetical protein AVEN_19008-1 [Araneus ventricosus]|uniref:DUF4219 domain-containing protein n=1 Tax=Araneus ventricosus TaxID=182803 RepID=A0A4Y2KK30_ARAVE|nr:hypothetical protein AVEN_19008-1 [Araneus ventricosus]
MDAELKYYVDQFDGANFAIWERRIESIFVEKDLDKFSEADETKENEVSASKKAYALMFWLRDRNGDLSVPSRRS